MFSFHKPKVYRSTSGCCICKAKSSSSRFTDSRKYEEDFVECFQLDAPRSGEVCNACVLLVKRWKKLPPGNQRNWRHVVDARSGPGIKSFVKIKSKKNLKYKIKSKKHIDQEVVDNSKKVGLVNDDQGDFVMTDISEETEQLSDPPSPSGSPVEEEEPIALFRRPKKRVISPPVSSFLDMTYWKEEKVCCGVIFKGLHNEIIIDPRLMTPCRLRRAAAAAAAAIGAPPASPPTALAVPPPAVTKAYSDNSSDSGYDESSNPGEVQSNPAHN